MKRIAVAVCLISAFLIPHATFAQVPQLINYQGRLLSGTNLVNGTVGLSLRLFNISSGGTAQYEDSNSVTVSDGLYSTFIGDQTNSGVFASALTNASVWVEVAVNGTALAPRERLASVAYALRANSAAGLSGTLPDSQLSTNVALLNVPNLAQQATGVPTVSFGFVVNATVTSGGSGYVTPPLVTVNGTGGAGAVIVASIFGGAVTGLAVTANGSSYPTNGTTTLTIAPPPSNAYQTFGGVNFFTGANTATNPANLWAGSFSGDGSGLTNLPVPSAWRLSGNAGTTNGNFIGTTDGQPLDVRVGGARALRISPATGGAPNLIGGAEVNAISNGTVAAIIAGGSSNSIQASSDDSVLGGGEQNSIRQNADHSVLGGGWQNSILSSSALSFLGGGFGNSIQSGAGYSFLGGGNGNSVQSGAYYSFLGGGWGNIIQANNSPCFLGGGYQNTIQSNASGAFLGGGQFNTIQNGDSYAVIAGGFSNNIQVGAYHSAIGGGFQNSIQASAIDSFLGGGNANSIQPISYYSALVGGNQNSIQTNSAYSFLGGGQLNNINSGSSYSVLVGGWQNTIESNATKSFIGGGEGNQIRAGTDHSFVGGGYNNIINTSCVRGVISGGIYNSIKNYAADSVIGGGGNNVIGTNATASVIPGGYDNAVGTNANFSFAAGHYAKANHPGTFVWSDDQNANFTSTANNEVSFRCSGGVRFSDGFANTVSWIPGAGSWTFVSDRNAKTNIVEADTQNILERINALPLAEWNYIGYPQRHVGPMAQDFHAAFPWSGDDKSINSADETGVALAAIQALAADGRIQKSEVRSQQDQIGKLQTENAELKKMLLDLRARLDALEKK